MTAGLRIALLGTRGIPAAYGGFETFYEHLGPMLVERGHHVTVYNRRHEVGEHGGKRYLGVELIEFPSIHTKHFDTISHTCISVVHTLFRHYDVVVICGVGNTPLAWLPRLSGAKVVLNVDSADWRRAKWGRIPRAYLRSIERFAAASANRIVADNASIQRRYSDSYGASAAFIPYGANLARTTCTTTIRELGLEPHRYVLWVGRMEPETRLEELIQAFEALGSDKLKLVVVGDAPFAPDYRRHLEGMAGPNVMFVGYQYGEAYRELGSHAFAFVQTSPTSGTSPALLEQMALGNAVIVRGTLANCEVIDRAGLPYDQMHPTSSLTAMLRRLIDEPDLWASLRQLAPERVARSYSWDAVVDRYEQLFGEVTGRLVARTVD